jgi:hypothetical protein
MELLHERLEAWANRIGETKKTGPDELLTLDLKAVAVITMFALFTKG